MSSVIGTYISALSSKKYKASLMAAGLKPSSTRVTLRCLKVPVISMVSWKTSNNYTVAVFCEQIRIWGKRERAGYLAPERGVEASSIPPAYRSSTRGPFVEVVFHSSEALRSPVGI